MNSLKPKEKKLRRDERREAIIRGAAEAFVKNGYEATSLDDVARSSGVSRALLYRHFDTKQAIYQAVIDSFLDVFHGHISKGEDKWASSTIPRLIETAQIDPNGFRLFFRHSGREPDFRSYYEGITAKRISYIDEHLKDEIKDNKQRHFIAELIQNLVISTILIWVDNDMPNPEQMSKVVGNILSSIIDDKEK